MQVNLTLHMSFCNLISHVHGALICSSSIAIWSNQACTAWLAQVHSAGITYNCIEGGLVCGVLTASNMLTAVLDRVVGLGARAVLTHMQVYSWE